MTAQPLDAGTVEKLIDFIEAHPRLLVLTGAGCSTDSGIPDYRNASGEWKHQRPVQFQDFLSSESVRQRYWARSLVGWPRFSLARPNPAHSSLARLETAGMVRHLVTQNVDGLHQRAGSRRVLDLHGRLDTVECLSCHERSSRESLQQRLLASNPGYRHLSAGVAPDGDALLERSDFSGFRIPNCQRCGGLLKPAVVFFGESVPRDWVEFAYRRLAKADALLVVGSSLMVYSGYRYCRAAAEQGKPVAAINLGRTRADGELALKITGNCGEVLSGLVHGLGL